MNPLGKAFDFQICDVMSSAPYSSLFISCPSLFTDHCGVLKLQASCEGSSFAFKHWRRLPFHVFPFVMAVTVALSAVNHVNCLWPFLSVPDQLISSALSLHCPAFGLDLLPRIF